MNDIVGIVATPGGGGYFLVGKDGGVFTFGNAPFLGSLPGHRGRVNNITGIAATPDGKGYYVVGANGAVYAFGDATSHGSLPGLGVTVSDIVSIVPTPDGGGYWLIGSDGGVFAFGDATSGVAARPRRPRQQRGGGGADGVITGPELCPPSPLRPRSSCVPGRSVLERKLMRTRADRILRERNAAQSPAIQISGQNQFVIMNRGPIIPALDIHLFDEKTLRDPDAIACRVSTSGSRNSAFVDPPSSTSTCRTPSTWE